MVVELIKPDELEKFVQLRQIFIEVFKEDAPALNEEQFKQLRDNRSFIAIGATVGFELVGGLAAHIVTNYYKGGLDLFIYDIAIKPDHQKKGIGNELIKFAKQFCIDHKIKEMYVSAESVDEKALSYYRNSEGKEVESRYFVYKFD
ncbi:MAG: aminoglycoside 3-N-acetyltransferase I [Arenicella sp.]|jgi:aminoglycoside 3-N-acetyltransferase I